MSRRAFLVRMLVMIQGCALVGLAMLILAIFFLLDLGPEAQRIALISHILYGAVVSVFVTGLVVWRLWPVVRLLGVWDRGDEPTASLLSDAQTRALRYPNWFLAEVAVVVLLVNAIALFVGTQFLGYQLAQYLAKFALTISFALGIGSAVHIGLRMLLRAVLRRIPRLPEATLPLVPVWAQTGLMTVLLGLIVLTLGGVFTYSSVVNAVDQGAADERGRWLQNSVIPQALSLHADQRLDYVAQWLIPGEEPFFLDRTGRVWGSEALPYGLGPDQVRGLAQVQGPRLYRQDYATLRVLAVPFDGEQVLCIAYQSPAHASPIVLRMVRILLFFSLGALLLTLSVGVATGGSISRTIRDVAGRLFSLAGEDMSLGHAPIAQTSLDEVGNLVQAFNRAQQRADAYTAQLRDSVAELEAANEQRRMLLETTGGLTAPVIRVAEGLVVVPLAGYFDAERAEHIRPNLLAGIVDHRARIVVVDLTGITQATDALADNLMRAARAVVLMGCQIILTGAGPDVAWTLTQIGDELEMLTAHRDLEEGLAYARTRLATN